jgi:hypothetical protein
MPDTDQQIGIDLGPGGVHPLHLAPPALVPLRNHPMLAPGPKRGQHTVVVRQLQAASALPPTPATSRLRRGTRSDRPGPPPLGNDSHSHVQCLRSADRTGRAPPGLDLLARGHRRPVPLGQCLFLSMRGSPSPRSRGVHSIAAPRRPNRAARV